MPAGLTFFYTDGISLDSGTNIDDYVLFSGKHIIPDNSGVNALEHFQHHCF